MLVRDVMATEVVTLSRQQSLPLAEELMSLRRVRHLPVVDGERRLVGLVTHRDMLRAQISKLALLTADERNEIQLSVPVDRIMTLGVWTVHPDTAALEAARLLVDHRFGCLPVVNADHRLVGIVTEADFLERAISLLEKDPDREVASLMSRRVITLFEEQSLSLASELMSLRQVRHLPVVDDEDHLVGLVTHRDLLAAQSSALSTAPPFQHQARVRDIVQTDVWSVSPSTRAIDAARTLLDHRFGCLPVLDQGRLVGIVTEADFLEIFVEELAEDRRWLTRGDAPVNYYMSERMRTVVPSDSLEKARNMMIIYGVTCVGVVESQELLGVVSATDLLGAGDAVGTVDRIMSRDLVSARPQEAIADAARRMVACDVHRVFVVEGRTPIGVLSATDLMHAVRDLRIAEPVTSFATSPVFTVDASEPIESALELLEQAGITGVVVTRGGAPVGMFTQIEALASRELPRQTPTSNAMRRDFVALPGETPLYRAAGRAADLHARRVIALGGGGIEGILTGMDAARAIA